MKLVQKQLFKGTRVFEIVDDMINIQIKSAFKEERLTVMLAVLNPEPVISKSRLEFTSRVNNEVLVSLYLARPNTERFNAFVALLKQRAQEEYHAFAGLKAQVAPTLEGNVYEEPPDFDAPDTGISRTKTRPVNVEALETSIQMLSEYVDSAGIGALMDALEALRADPEDRQKLLHLAGEFDALGPNQGAVLTYAPYIGVLLSDDPLER